MRTVYKINKGINRPIEFKGIKAQYILYLAVGLLVLLLLFAILYLIGMPPVICLLFVIVAGTTLFLFVIRYSNKYGEHGLMKEAAWRKIPACLHSRKRRPLSGNRNKKNELWK